MFNRRRLIQLSRKSPTTRARRPSGETPQGQSRKIRRWTLPTILGLILGAAGLVGLIELRPQMGVLPQEPLHKDQPFSVPFRITNNGYFSFHVVRVTCYLHKIEALNGHFRMTDSTLGYDGWDGGTLDREESETIVCNMTNLSPPIKADIAIVIDFDTLFRPKSRRYFRFVGEYG